MGERKTMGLGFTVIAGLEATSIGMKMRQAIWELVRTECVRRSLFLCLATGVLMQTGCGGGAAAAPRSSSGSVQPSLQAPGTVSATAHPLVAEYDLAVADRSQVSVEFGTNTNYGRSTGTQVAPAGGGTVATLVAGMRANTTYHMRARVLQADNTTLLDSDHTFTTGPMPQASYPIATVTSPSAGGSTTGTGVDLISSLGTDISGVVLDRDGSVIWYYFDPTKPGFVDPIRQLSDGNFLVNFGDDLRIVDLAGRIVREVTVSEINTALLAAGYSVQSSGMHHDALLLPNGDLILLMHESRDFQDLPGHPGTTTVAGDVLVDLNANNRPVWVWSAFDHLDVNRHPFNFPDWTHSNALTYTPDGNLMLSMRHQSWILKIDYANGSGSGDVLWKLGAGGDFSLAGNDPTQWYYCQHFPDLLSTRGSQFSLAVFDNGNMRPDSTGQPCGISGTCYTRAVTMNVDEVGRTAQVTWHDAPGWFSFWGGSIGYLPNGNVEFDSTTPDNAYSRVIEVTPSATPQIVWEMDSTNGLWYRAYAIPSLYPGVYW